MSGNGIQTRLKRFLVRNDKRCTSPLTSVNEARKADRNPTQSALLDVLKQDREDWSGYVPPARRGLPGVKTNTDALQASEAGSSAKEMQGLQPGETTRPLQLTGRGKGGGCSAEILCGQKRQFQECWPSDDDDEIECLPAELEGSPRISDSAAGFRAEQSSNQQQPDCSGQRGLSQRAQEAQAREMSHSGKGTGDGVNAEAGIQHRQPPVPKKALQSSGKEQLHSKRQRPTDRRKALAAATSRQIFVLGGVPEAPPRRHPPARQRPKLAYNFYAGGGDVDEEVLGLEEHAGGGLAWEGVGCVNLGRG